jgi:hypothetical protein
MASVNKDIIFLCHLCNTTYEYACLSSYNIWLWTILLQNEKVKNRLLMITTTGGRPGLIIIIVISTYIYISIMLGIRDIIFGFIISQVVYGSGTNLVYEYHSKQTFS